MIHAFIVGLGNRQGIEKEQEQQNALKYLSEHPMLKELEEAIDVMEHHIAEAISKHKLLTQFRHDILKSFGIKEEANPENETKHSEGKPEKAETIPPLVKSADPRLAILEKGIRKVIKIFKTSPMLTRSKNLKLPLKAVIAALEKTRQCPSEAERIVQLEAAIGEGLNCFQNSKMALRSKVLKEIKKILEETIDSKNQVGK